MLTNVDSMITYPVFPDWIFEGKLQLSHDDTNKLIAGMNNITRIQTEYGWISEKNSLTPALQKMRQLTGAMFYDKVISHYRLPEKTRKIENVNSEIYCVKPGFYTQTTVNRKRWYQTAVFLSPQQGSCDLQLNMYGEKRQTIPRAVMEEFHIIPSERCKVVFWPAHIPWNLTVNGSGENCLVYTDSFIFSNYHR